MKNGENEGLLEEILSKKAVIFDLDGTLVDSMWMWYDIDVEFLAMYHLDCPPDLQRVIEGMSFSETADYFKERFSLPDSTDEIKKIWIQMSYDKYAHEVPLREGAREFIDLLREKDIRLGIATSNDKPMAEAVLEANGISGCFDVIITSSEVTRGKPAPDMYLTAAKELSVSPSECMVFEDVVAGIRSGKAAGMKVCAVEEKNSLPYRDEIISLADYYIRDYEELTDT